MKTKNSKRFTLTVFLRTTFYCACTLFIGMTSFASNLGELTELKETFQSIQRELNQVKADRAENNLIENIDKYEEAEPKADKTDKIEIIQGKEITKDPITPIFDPQNQESINPIEPAYYPMEQVPLPSSDQSPSILSKRFSSNYLIISPSISVSDDIGYKFTNGTTGEIDTGSGFGLHLDLGKKINNWEIGVSLGFERTPLDNLLWDGNLYRANGDSISYQLMFSPGYRFHFSDSFSLRTGLSLGFANRHDNYEIEFLLPRSLNEENIVFLGQINFALAYKASQHTSLFLGYRYGYLGDSGPFDSVSSHVFEFGAVWDL
jgi:hypothetical protein